MLPASFSTIISPITCTLVKSMLAPTPTLMLPDMVTGSGVVQAVPSSTKTCPSTIPPLVRLEIKSEQLNVGRSSLLSVGLSPPFNTRRCCWRRKCRGLLLDNEEEEPLIFFFILLFAGITDDDDGEDVTSANIESSVMQEDENRMVIFVYDFVVVSGVVCLRFVVGVVVCSILIFVRTEQICRSEVITM